MSDASFPRETLGNLTLAIRDGTHASHRRVEHGVPLLSAKNIAANGELIFDETDDRISEEEYRGLLRSFRMEPGDLLLTIVGSLGRRAIYSGERVAFQRSVAFLRPDQRRIGSRFLFHWMGHPAFSAEILRRCNATAQAGVYLGELADLSVPVPDLAIQGGIGQILDTLDTAIRETEAIIAKLKAVKQGLLHDLLTRGIDANGELRPPQTEAPHLYKESPLGWIPKEWNACELNSLVDPARPIVYGILMPGYGHPGGVPVVKVKDIFEDSIKLDALLLTSPQIDREYSRSRLCPGDLLFTIRGTVGRMALVPEQLRNANITQDTARVAIKFTDVRFVKACLATLMTAQFVSIHTLGVAVQGINLRDVRRILVPRPSSDEATRIADRLDEITERLVVERRALDKMALIKSGLMDDLLTGRVRVTPLLEATET